MQRSRLVMLIAMVALLVLFHATAYASPGMGVVVIPLWMIVVMIGVPLLLSNFLLALIAALLGLGVARLTHRRVRFKCLYLYSLFFCFVISVVGGGVLSGVLVFSDMHGDLFILLLIVMQILAMLISVPIGIWRKSVRESDASGEGTLDASAAEDDVKVDD